MADFVAVIRRAVDGLSDNSPDNRARVYDKARTAIRRQLENMSPPPPQELVGRQLDKLEAAIAEVESEHAEALPPQDVPAEPFAAPPEPLAPADDALTPRDAAEPGAAEPEAGHPAIEEPEASAPPQMAEDRMGPDDVSPPDAPAEDDPARDGSSRNTRPQDGPPEDPPLADRPAADGPSGAAVREAAPVSRAGPTVAARPADPTAGGPLPGEAAPPDEPHSSPARPDPAAVPLPSAYAPAPAGEDSPRDVPSAFGSTHRTRPADPYGLSADDRNAVPLAAGGAKLAPDLPGTAAPGEAGRDTDALHDVLAPDGPEGRAPAPGPLAGDAHDALFGLDEDPAGPAGRSRSRGVGRTVTIGLLLLVLAGTGYALWTNRDAVLTALPGAGQDAAQEGDVAAGGPDGAEGTDGPGSDGGAPQGEQDELAALAPDGEPEAAPDAGADGRKFTQRLLPDGSEVDPGPAPQPDTDTTAEGRTVAARSGEENAPEAVAPGGGQDEAPAATAAGEPGLGVAQNMYLYEERLGQQAPTALEGSVVWTVERERPGDDTPSEPAIHGEISVPERNMTALMTIKRNSDPSLPASHLIEIVFALPSDFGGGGIESVQRVTFKQTEQDRGDPLIAVPAKITEDFFMVALNDFDEAVENNLTLLRQRNWIDIPITYANGRRALITLEKGSSGSEVFEEVLGAWAARQGAQGAPADGGGAANAAAEGGQQTGPADDNGGTEAGGNGPASQDAASDRPAEPAAP